MSKSSKGVSLSGAPECPSMSFKYRKGVAGGSSPQDGSPQSFSKKKEGSMGGDLRPMNYRADSKLSAAK